MKMLIKYLIIFIIWVYGTAFGNDNSPNEMHIAIASEGNTDKGLHTEFSVFAFPLHEKLSIRAENLPPSATLTDHKDGTARFVWGSPVIGNHKIIFVASGPSGTYSKEFVLKVGDYGYPPENAGPMIFPEFPPPASSEIIYVSSSGKDSNSGVKISPVTVKKALDLAREKVVSATKPVYILFKRGDYWPGSGSLGIYENLKGKRDAPVVFGAYGEGDLPHFESFISRASIEYLHFQDILFNQVRIHGNKYSSIPEKYPGTDIEKLVLEERYVVQRLRFHQCRFEREGLTFFNIFSSAGRGSRVPDSNGWWGGGPLAGMIRDIEIGHSVFLHIHRGGTPDAINFTAVDRGVWIHHNLFKDTREEHIDISGGYGHVIEHNLGLGTVTNNGIKLHSQFSLLTDSIIRNNTILYSGGWRGKPVGGSGNAFVALNTMGCKIIGNNFISRWAAGYGDDDRIDDRGYFGTSAGNIIEGNIYGGGVQIVGFRKNTANKITERNLFRNNLYRSWINDDKLLRFWNKQIGNKALVGKDITAADFSEWVQLSVTGERYYKDLDDIFENPFNPKTPNQALDIQNPGNWKRKPNLWKSCQY